MLINKAKVKAYALEQAKSRAQKFTRVSAEFYLLCDGQMREFIRGHINRLPSKGKTIQ